MLDLSIFSFELPVSGGQSIDNLFELVDFIEEEDGDVGGRHWQVGWLCRIDFFLEFLNADLFNLNGSSQLYYFSLVLLDYGLVFEASFIHYLMQQ